MLYEYLKGFMAETPSRTLSDDTRQITYHDLLEQAEALGRELNQEKYGILCQSELAAATALMACFAANKTAVPLSYRYGKTHAQRIIERLQLSHIITDDGIQRIAQPSPEPEDLSDVALIMCTSGTTGVPKGAMITKQNLITNLEDISSYFALDRNDHILITRPLYHCAVLTGEFLISLVKGLNISFSAAAFSPAAWLNTVRGRNATVFCGTPTTLSHLASLNLRKKEPVSPRVIAVSGECMTASAAARLREAFPQTLVYHVYGLTEASPRVSFLPPEEFDLCPTSVGRPLPSLRARIVNDELLVDGKSVMKGYYNDPRATASAMPDGWLHTGDLARQDQDGRLYILCRKDNMIIRSGMNIYPQEIENALRQDLRIDDVLAFGVRDSSSGEKIHLHVVSRLSKSEVFSICKERLPAFELPDQIEMVEELPKNASGKVIRQKGRVS